MKPESKRGRPIGSGKLLPSQILDVRVNVRLSEDDNARLIRAAGSPLNRGHYMRAASLAALAEGRKFPKNRG
jgi:hypothetical protein